MSTPKIIPIVVGIVVVGIAAMLAMVQPSTGKTSTSDSSVSTSTGVMSNTSPTSTTTQGNLPGHYTLAQVALHKDASSCWTTINGNVYDLTNWIYEHPGGEGAILSICGIDGSAAFTGQHGGQSKPEQELATLKIGVLTQ